MKQSLMNPPQTIDFLNQPAPERLRKEIQNICDSYSHSWDLLSELTQNAVDAIALHRKQFGDNVKKHKIDITVNCSDRSVEVLDSGIGFSFDKFSYLLAPHGTDKVPTDPVIGQKGVGLKYTIFISNFYNIATCSPNGLIEGTISNACSWRRGHGARLPVFTTIKSEKNDNSAASTFTRILVKDVERMYDESEDLFSQPIQILQLLLRTKTAIGYLKKCFGKDQGLDIIVNLTLITTDGKTQTEIVKPFYLLPEELIASNRYIDLDDFKEQAATLDDAQKGRKLQGKCLRKVGSVVRANKNINYYCFFGSRNLWADISSINHLSSTNSNGEVTNFYEGGIYSASRGMPTGIRLEAPRTGNFSYWPAFYIILEDDSIIFDLGRKAIPSRTVGLLREIAKGLFNEFAPFFAYVSSDPPAVTMAAVQQHERSKFFSDLELLPDLKQPNINYLKHPDSQEAAVVALFHELVGAKVLQGYFTLKTGYKMTYDLWGKYAIDKMKIGQNCRRFANQNNQVELPLVIEFKYRGEDILIDFESDRKYFTDIDMIVC